jgi:hypothetical protein
MGQAARIARPTSRREHGVAQGGAWGGARLAVAAAAAAAAWVASGAACDPAPPAVDVCFATDLLPLVAADCAICHENAEYGVRLRGEPRDHDALVRFVDSGDEAALGLLDIVAGGGDHPPVWPPDRPEHRTLAAWIAEGARSSCEEVAE